MESTARVMKQTGINSAVETKSATPIERNLQGVAREVEITSLLLERAKEREAREQRYQALQNLLLSKRQEIMKEVRGYVGQSLTVEQQRRSESVGDAGDQALLNHERERDIFVMEMRNRRRQSLDEALIRLHEGTYGTCAECGIDINEKRLQVVPFAKLCAECLSRIELLENVERQEAREEF